MELFAKAKALQVADAGLWIKLALCLYDNKKYPQALTAFERVSGLVDGGQTWDFVALVWQDSILDLLARRSEALERYESALTKDNGWTPQHDQYGTTINRARVQQRIKMPFRRD